MDKSTKIAVIGAGISGLSTAYHLYQDYDVTVFEKQNYLGGHTDTHHLCIEGQTVHIDSGFIIFCPQYYPHFSAMLKALGVESQATDMSFSAHNQQSGTLYNATSLDGLFCQRKNLFKPTFWRMLFDIVRFYRSAPKVLDSNQTSVTVNEYLQQQRYGRGFSEDHLLPMISALWSATPQRVLEFPIHYLVDFFQRHGLLKLIGRPQWRVITGGSNQYVKALYKQTDCHWHTGTPVENILRDKNQVVVRLADGSEQTFNKVVLACHADQALALLDTPSKDEKRILGSIPFQPNHVVVHTDDSIMPTNKRSWASWNTVVPDASTPLDQQQCTANYWMNALQSLDMATNVFTTLNSAAHIDPNKILVERQYAHPVFTLSSVAAIADKRLIDGQQNTYYAGAYWGWGFHEDGARSAYQISQQIRQGR